MICVTRVNASSLPRVCLSLSVSLQDEASTLRLLKEQLALEQKVENYAETVGFLSQQCRRMLELGHPDR